MIAEEATAERLDELRHVLRTSLLKSGIMGTMRAQLRTSAIDILKGTSNNHQEDPLKEILGTHELPDEGTPEYLATLLVFDFLNHSPTLKRSSGVFSEESGLSLNGNNFGVQEAKEMSKDLKMENDFSPKTYQQEPLLVSAVKKMMSGVVTASVSRPQSLSARHSPAPEPTSRTSIDGGDRDVESPRSQQPSAQPSPTKSSSASASASLKENSTKQEVVTKSADPTAVLSMIVSEAGSNKDIQQQMNVNKKSFRTKDFKDVVVDGNKVVANKSEVGDWDFVDNVDKTFSNTKKEVATSADVKIVSKTAESSSSSAQQNKASSNTAAPVPTASKTNASAASSASVVSSSSPLPVLSKLPSLNQHARTLAPLDPPIVKKGSNDNLASSSLSLSNRSNNNNIAVQPQKISSPTTTAAAASVSSVKSNDNNLDSYDNDFEDEEDDDTF